MSASNQQEESGQNEKYRKLSWETIEMVPTLTGNCVSDEDDRLKKKIHANNSEKPLLCSCVWHMQEDPLR